MAEPPVAFPPTYTRDYVGSLAALDSTMQQGASLRRAYSMRTKCLEAMRIYLKRIGLDAAALAKIPTLHVTGSKGKGSTCAFLEAILRAKGLRTGASACFCMRRCEDGRTGIKSAVCRSVDNKLTSNFPSTHTQCSSPPRTWSR